MTDKTTTTPPAAPVAQAPQSEVVAMAVAAALEASKTVDETVAAAQALIATEKAKEATFGADLEMGQKILVSGVLADQVNPLTNQRITHGNPVVAVYDRWIEIQGGAGVLARHDL